MKIKVEYVKATIGDSGIFEHEVVEVREYWNERQAMKKAKKFNRAAQKFWTADQYQYAAVVPVKEDDKKDGTLDP